MKYILYPIFAFVIFVLGAQSNHHFEWFNKPVSKGAEVNSVAATLAEHPEWPGMVEKLGLAPSVSDPNVIELHQDLKEHVSQFQTKLNKNAEQFENAAKNECDVIEALKLTSPLSSGLSVRLSRVLVDIESYFGMVLEASKAFQSEGSVDFSKLNKYVNQQCHSGQSYDVIDGSTVDLLVKLERELFDHLKRLGGLPADARSAEYISQLDELKALQGSVMRVIRTRQSEVSFVENTVRDIEALRKTCVEKLADSHLQNNSKIRDLVRKHFANLHKTSEN